MKLTKFIIWPIIFSSFLMITACGGGGGGGDSTGSGEVSMSITDAKPLLPDGATNLWITFTEVLVHKSGGGWISLPLTGDLPTHTIDLLQFYDGYTTELVPPVLLEYGQYTQIRLVIESAKIRFDNDPETDTPVEIPSGNLKTDKNFIFDPQNPSAADILIDFDLSQSLVVTGPSEAPSYKLKPVLHIVYTSEAATITGAISNTSFVNPDASITVLDANDEVYTKLTVERDQPNDVVFNIFWLVPDKNYKVEIDFDKDGTVDWDEDITAGDLQPGEDFKLNGGNPI